MTFSIISRILQETNVFIRNIEIKLFYFNNFVFIQNSFVPYYFQNVKISIFCFLTLFIPGGGHICPTTFISSFISKNFPATYDETLCKFLLYTYEDSRNLFWSKKLSRGHVEDINVAWVENCKNKNCNFRVLRGILEGFFIKQKLFKIKKYKRKVTFVF